jgi:aryl-alcohol dehydrogenase-like predicted oxidoreductase
MEGLEWLRDRNLTEDRLKKVKSIKSIADDLSISMPQLAIAWCLKNNNVSTVILGASKVKQLEENLDAVDKLHLLSSEIMMQIDEVLSNKPIIPEF